MKLTIGFSTCPNDTFIFDALINKKINTEGLEFEPFLADVEDLNQRALNGALDITKVSYHAFLYARSTYRPLNAGSALGHNCGPLLISKKSVDVHALPSHRIAIPGTYTTANLLLQFYLGRKSEARPLIFSDIESALLEERFDAGVIIHESRFTYAQKGLRKLVDLGEFWESKTHLPVPLGAIVIRKSLGPDLHSVVDRLLRKSTSDNAVVRSSWLYSQCSN